MTTNHTAGPWGIHTFYQKLEIHPADDEDGITVIADLTFGDTETRAQCESNARLIAEAPAMAEALRSNRLMLHAWRAARINMGLKDDHAELLDCIRQSEAILARIDNPKEK